jgi:hypothetical protein
MDKAAIITVVSQYDKKLEEGANLPVSPIGAKLLERTAEMLKKNQKL